MTVESHPDFPDWTLYGIPQNWADACELETAFQTVITASADSVMEERRILLGHPSRTQVLNWRGLSRERLHKILTSMRGMTSGQWVIPIYPDQSELTVDYSSGTSIYCSTSGFRFEVGGHVLVLEELEDGTVGNFEWAEVEEIHADHLVLTDALDNSYQVGLTLVLPCMDVEPVLSPEISLISGRVGNISLTTQEVIGPSTLSAFEGTPSGFSEFLGYPILYLEHNWVEALSLSYAREGTLDSLGRGRVFHLRGDRPRLTTELSLLLERDDAISMIHFFEGRKGRALPFWLMDPEDLWEILASDSGGVNIEPLGEFSDFEENLEFIGFRDVDGAVHVRKVSNVVDWGTYWRVSVTTAMPSGTLIQAAKARLSRFDSDALSEEWVTTNAMRTKIKTIELLEENP